MDSDDLSINRANWDERAPVHAASALYGLDRYLSDPAAISDIVRFDLPRLGAVSGLRGVHLQCHIGTDTISLARLGARMTGLDFSPASVAEARTLAAAAGADVDFVEADVDAALDVLPAGGFDLVFTGVGALCWLPDIRRWAAVVAGLLKPGGRLFLRETHPMLWAIDEAKTDDLVVGYPYSETPEPMVFDEQGSYAETDAQFAHTESRNWNHGLGEIITALLDEGMTLTAFEEHDSVPSEALPGRMEKTDQDEWRLADRPERLPHSYTLQAVKA